MTPPFPSFPGGKLSSISLDAAAFGYSTSGALLSFGHRRHRALVLGFGASWRWALLLAVPVLLWPLIFYSVDGQFYSTAVSP